MSSAGELSGRKPRFFDLPQEQHERDPNDWYIEPVWTTELLLAAEAFEGAILDPACGSGRIVDACRAAGYDATGSDLVDRCGGRFRVGDFFGDAAAADNIVSNPPYRVPAEFALHALARVRRKVALLVQAKFLYSQGRHALFTGTPVARIYHLSTRPSLPPGSLLLAGRVKASGGKMDFAWVVWDHGYKGAPTTHWLKRGDGLEAEYREACGAIRERSGAAAPLLLDLFGAAGPDAREVAE
jgi:hypothetical protein